MKFVLIIFLIILIVVSFIFLKKINKSKKDIMKTFKAGNVVVYGLRGCGKDLLFQYVIYLRHQGYYSNIDYGYDCHSINISDLNVGNTFENFINDTVHVIDKIEEREGKDIYLSDVGVYLPSQHDKLLHSKYTGLPVYYALSRHLYNSNIHVNSQKLERVWKPLREQADSFVKCIGVKKIFDLFILKYCIYDREQSAIEDIRPLKTGVLTKKELKFRVEEFESKYGSIKEGILLIPKKVLKYDTRVFHEKIFGKKFQD